MFKQCEKKCKNVKLIHDGMNSSYFIYLILNVLTLFCCCCFFIFVKIETLCSFQTYVVTQVVYFSGPYRKIRTVQGASQNAHFQRRPVELHNKYNNQVVSLETS